jgi:hypothetical protein
VSPNDAFSITLSGAPTQSYRFEAATNLTASNDWVTVSNVMTGTNGQFIFIDPQRTNFSRRFFRVRAME